MRTAETARRRAALVAGTGYLVIFVLAIFANVGVHLMLLGYLLATSGWAPKALGYVLQVAGAAYVVDTLANALLPAYAQYADLFLVMVAVPSVVGELWLTVWLLTRAGRARGGTTAATRGAVAPTASEHAS